MILKWVENPGFGSNTYIIACEETHEGAVIDPGVSAKPVVRLIESEKIQVKYIINTHGHIDHIAANRGVYDATKAEIMIHEKDAKMLTNVASNLSMLMGQPVTSPPANRLLKDGDTIQIGKTIELQVLHTPGHTDGGICLYTPGVLFSGDTLFAQSIGRTDFPGGSMKTLLNAIRTKLFTLPDETMVYPGHMGPTNIGFEKQHNPFL